MSQTPFLPGRNGQSYVLITGGAGFIGCNLADQLVRRGFRVLLFDNLSRPGVSANVDWLRSTHGNSVELFKADVRDGRAVRQAVEHASAVFHFAAQVAVTTSIDDPMEDFGVNVVGTLNVLEAIRHRKLPPPLFYTSTNKVYGHLTGLSLRSTGTRYEPIEHGPREQGLSEAEHLDFHSPYGCSKGAAEQYVLDYHRTYGLRTCVFRMSCIYGPHQFGTEDQGWVAHFLISARNGKPVTIYGDGRQVRDILFVEDLANAFQLAWRHIDQIAGRAFNMGGGPGNTLSLRELIRHAEEFTGRKLELQRAEWRTGDQRYYVSDTSRFRRATLWQPKVGVAQGLRRLFDWLHYGSPAVTPAAA